MCIAINRNWVTGIGNITANGTVAYTGSYYSSALNMDQDEVPDRTQVDVSLIWSDLTEKIRVRAFVDNVFDEGYIRGVGITGEGSNWIQTGEYLYPRYYGVDIRYAFGGS